MIEATGSDTATNHLNAVSLGFKPHELELLLKKPLPADLSRFSPAHSANTDPLKLARDIDIKLSLEGDLLVKVDRASMLCSLECRAPFLDHRLAEFTNRIPDQFLIKGNNKKRILKDTFEDLLPAGFFNSPKSGFEVPVSHWFRNELKTDLIHTLSDENCSEHGFFNYAYIASLLTEHIDGNIDHSYKLWSLYCFQKWYMSNIAH
jgi:asparagine synthase (glutamine-hydrolysing)